MPTGSDKVEESISTSNPPEMTGSKIKVHELEKRQEGNGATPARSHPLHTQVEAAHLFRQTSNGQYAGRVLIPRPTSDPKDPLTWSPWRKHLTFASILFFVLLSNFGVSIATPAFGALIHQFHITPTQASYLLTYQILLLGIGNLFWMPLSLKIGKRPVCVVASALFFASAIWSAKAQSYPSLLASRIFAGFAGSASEAIGPAVVADVYFLHDRATLTAIYTFMIGAGPALGGIFSGLIINATPNWRWIFWMVVITNGACFLLIVFFFQETNFIRPPEAEAGDDSATDSVPDVVQSDYTFAKGLSLTGWYDRETSLLLYLYRPLQLLFYPTITWAAICYGVSLGWLLFQSSANSILFAEIYHFSPLAIGNLYISNIIGAVIGCIYSGPFCDWFVAVITKRHNGYFQPEYRLFLMIPPLIFGPVGLLMWGLGIQHELHWSVPAVGFGITYSILCSVPNIGITYVIDSYRPVAGEAMTSLTAFKNTFAFGFSFAVFPWIERNGVGRVAIYQTIIEVAIFLSTIPVFFFGEKLRRWSSKFDV